jgi:predicted ester cyclase
MSDKENLYEKRKENDRLFFGYVNQKDFTAMNNWIDEYVSEDFINRSPALGVSTDREGLKEMFRLLIEAFPDIMFEISDMVAEGDKMAFKLIISGTHKGPLMGIPPTGKSFKVENAAIITFSDNKIIERWVVSDTLGQLQQLGLMNG